MDWIIKQAGFSLDDTADLGNRFLVGNGYLGVRGTMEEYGKAQLVAVNLAGIYHKVGDAWREPLNAPNPFFARLSRQGNPVDVPDAKPDAHSQWLDIQHGVHGRETVFGDITIRAERFACMDNVHLLAMRYEANWQGDACTLECGID